MNSDTQKQWSLHPRLAQDTVPVGDLALSHALLANDANYPWLILVPRLPALVENIDLEPNNQRKLMREIDAAARALKSAGPLRQAQYRRARQPGGAIARTRNCTPEKRRRLAAVDMGRRPTRPLRSRRAR